MPAVRFLFLVALICVAIGADAQSSILHEFVPPDPNEDVAFATTTLDGDLPAAIQTPSGLATAPDPRRSPDPDRVYSGGTVDDGPDSTYEPDRDTRRPKVETYDDPFTPATAPFKRLRAFDAIDADYSLKVRDKTLRPLAIGGAAGAGDEAFYGDLSVDLIPDQPVRVPTVGPGARVLRMHVNPELKVTLLHDDADNWFIRGSEHGRVRLVMELAIPRATFGSAFNDVDWPELDKSTHAQPAAHQAAYQEVARSIGISRSMRPRDVLTKMVEYFRSFAASDEPPRARNDIYLDLALSRKGVCRHRSFAFLVTALHVGIPARMVVNEAHAWVEAFDGAIWHRIDLGGAAANLDQDTDPNRPAYLPPPDPFAWPDARDSGQDLVERARTDGRKRSSSGGSGPANGASGATSANAANSAAPTGSVPFTTDADEQPERPSEVTVAALDRDVRRGLPMHLQGTVMSGGTPCAHVRVDVLIVGAAFPLGLQVGSLSTDDHGAYDGAVVIPPEVAVGDYDLSVTTPGDTQCGPSARPGKPSTAR